MAPSKPDPLLDDLSAFLDGELSAERARQVERLLADSPDARHVLDELRAVSRSVGELPRRAAPPELTRRLQTLASPPAVGPPAPRTVRTRRLAIAARVGALAAVVIVSVWVGRWSALNVSPPLSRDAAGRPVTQSSPSMGVPLAMDAHREGIAAADREESAPLVATAGQAAVQGGSGVAPSAELRLVVVSASPDAAERVRAGLEERMGLEQHPARMQHHAIAGRLAAVAEVPVNSEDRSVTLDLPAQDVIDLLSQLEEAQPRGLYAALRIFGEAPTVELPSDAAFARPGEPTPEEARRQITKERVEDGALRFAPRRGERIAINEGHPSVPAQGWSDLVAFLTEQLRTISAPDKNFAEAPATAGMRERAVRMGLAGQPLPESPSLRAPLTPRTSSDATVRVLLTILSPDETAAGEPDSLPEGAAPRSSRGRTTSSPASAPASNTGPP